MIQPEEHDESEVTDDVVLTHIASEKVLAEDWLTAEEDLAWEDL